MAYTAGSFVADEQPTTSKWNQLWSNDASFNDGTGIGTAAVGVSKIDLTTFNSAIVSSSNLGSRSQTLTPSGSGTIAYSTNNPTIQLKPGTYLVVATASARAAMAAQDSSFNAVLYNDTTSAEVAAVGTTSTGGSVTVYPTFSAGSVVTPIVNTTYSARASQTFGSGAGYTYVCSTLIAIPVKPVA